MKIIPFKSQYQSEALELINSNLKDRFGQLDPTLNPDINDIASHFHKGTFLLALVRDNGGDNDEERKKICGTGGFLPTAEPDTVQIVRVHTHPAYRRRGIASKIVDELEEIAKARGVRRIVLETTDNWHDAIAFYEAKGYTKDHHRNDEIYFIKQLDTPKL